MTTTISSRIKVLISRNSLDQQRRKSVEKNLKTQPDDELVDETAVVDLEVLHRRLFRVKETHERRKKVLRRGRGTERLRHRIEQGPSTLNRADMISQKFKDVWNDKVQPIRTHPVRDSR